MSKTTLQSLATPIATAPVDWASKDLELERSGEKIILPNIPTDMPIEDGIKQLKRIQAAENMEYEISEKVPVHFFDGLVALAKALKEKFGYSGTTQTKHSTPFGPFFTPPKLLHVKTGPGIMDFVQVPFGSFQFPGVEGTIETEYDMLHGIPVLKLTGTVKSKEKKIVMEIVELVRNFAKQSSIYKGRSIILDRDNSGGIDYEEPLSFFDPTTGYEVPIFNPTTQALIDTTLLAPLANSQLCREMKIPLKRGILLEGPYGCGKSLMSRQAARTANANDWTFILVTDVKALKHALNFAKMYQPCVVFAEDIDRVAGNRGENANTLINDIDGVVGKNDEIITVLTTNYAEKIEKAFLRPGRLDTIISIRPPEAEAVERLIRHYAGEQLDPAADLGGVAEELKGNIAATIREVVERSKLGMIVKGNKHITTENLSVAAEGMKNHLKFLEDASEGKQDGEPIGHALQDIVYGVVTEVLAKEFALKRQNTSAKRK